MANKIVTIAVLGYMRCMVGGHGIVAGCYKSAIESTPLQNFWENGCLR